MSQPTSPIGPIPSMRPPGAAGARPVDVSWTDPSQRMPLITLGLLVVLLIAAYWDTLTLVSAAWSEPLYSHGYIVPVFALALMWMRWQPYQPAPAMERWLGVAIVVVSLAVRAFGVYMTMNPLDQISFLGAIFGVFMMVGGFHMIRWAGPALGFLVFMLPLPSVLEQNVLWRLQTIASVCSTFVLQTLGVAAFREGNLISVPGSALNIADACSGLRMLTIFGALAVAMVFLIDRPWWDKFVILLSAVPIALVVNIIRITVTGLLYVAVGPENHIAQKIGHDWAGLFMMPLAMGFLWIELQILERVTIPADTAQIRPIGGRATAIPVR